MNQSIAVKRRTANKWLGVLALLFAFISFGGSALAATPAPADNTDPSKVFVIGGTIQNCGKGVEGISIHVTGRATDATVLTNKAGKWEVRTPEDTQYLKDQFTVTLDKSTLPKGMTLIGSNVRTTVFNQVNSTGAAFRFMPGKCTDQGGSKPVFKSENQFLAALFNGLNFGVMLAMASIGLSLIYGTTGLSNFAHGEMVSIGALTTWLFNKVLLWDLIPSAMVAILVVGAFGYAQDALLWRPLRKKRIGLTQMMIVSIGLSMVVRYFLQMEFGGDNKVLTQGATWQILGISMPAVNVICAGLSVFVLIGFTLFLTRTRIGKATRAVADNPSLAASTGIDVEAIIRIVWIVASVLTGISGVFIGLYQQASWDTGFSTLLLIFAAVTLGGLGTSSGAAVGAMIIGLLTELSTLVISPDLKVASALFILILVLLVKPDGILGKKQRIG